MRQAVHQQLAPALQQAQHGGGVAAVAGHGVAQRGGGDLGRAVGHHGAHPFADAGADESGECLGVGGRRAAKAQRLVGDGGW